MSGCEYCCHHLFRKNLNLKRHKSKYTLCAYMEIPILVKCSVLKQLYDTNFFPRKTEQRFILKGFQRSEGQKEYRKYDFYSDKPY